MEKVIKVRERARGAEVYRRKKLSYGRCKGETVKGGGNEISEKYAVWVLGEIKVDESIGKREREEETARRREQ